MSHPTGTVCGVISLGAFFGNFAVQLPVLGVLVVGLILLAGPGRRLPRRSLLLARAGLAAMLAEAVARIAWAALLPQLLAQFDYDRGFLHTYTIATLIVGFVLSLLFAVGVGLLIGAVLTAGQPGSPPGYPPPGSFPPGHQ